jgi:hypothetical protein
MPQIRPSSPRGAWPLLPVGVVGDEVQSGDLGQLGGSLLGGVLEQGEVVLLELAVDEPLQGADAQGRILADHRGRNEAQLSGPISR